VIEKRNPSHHAGTQKRKKILVTGNPLFDDDKDIALVVTSVRDITELVELKDKLHERTWR
jgi:hypothetical protein